MKFSKTTEYSLRILSYMANGSSNLYNASELNEKLSIPLRYMRKQLTQLVKKGLLKSIQGKHGGYMIAKSSNEITLWDIVTATEDLQQTHECIFGFEDCVFGKSCSLHSKWNKVQDVYEAMLKSTTLEELKNCRTTRFGIQTININ